MLNFCNFRFHICITHMHTTDGVADRFINDVKDGLVEIMKVPDIPTEGKVRLLLL